MGKGIIIAALIAMLFCVVLGFINAGNDERRVLNATAFPTATDTSYFATSYVDATKLSVTETAYMNRPTSTAVKLTPTPLSQKG